MPTEVDSRSFFTSEGDTLIPQPIARGPWGQTMRGRLIGGLTAREVDRLVAEDPELRCTRLTVDMFRPPPLQPTRVSGRVVRSGGRIKVLEVTVAQDDGPVGQGRAVLLRRTEQPPGEFRPTPRWEAPTPFTGLEQSDSHRFTPSWDAWNVGAPDSMSEGLWLRENHDLVDGERLSPLIRVALASDVASPMLNTSAGRRVAFINADYTTYIGRAPRGEHIGIQPYGQVSADGLSVGQCVLHDVDGPLGFVTTTAIANSVERANRAAAGG